MSLTDEGEIVRGIHADLNDSYDEELELELDDERLTIGAGGDDAPADAAQREKRQRYSIGGR